VKIWKGGSSIFLICCHRSKRESHAPKPWYIFGKPLYVQRFATLRNLCTKNPILMDRTLPREHYIFFTRALHFIKQLTCSLKRALYSSKRAVYSLKRAALHPQMSTEAWAHHRKSPLFPLKQPYSLSKEPYILSKEPPLIHKCPQRHKQNIKRALNFLYKSPIFKQKSRIFTQKSRLISADFQRGISRTIFFSALSCS